MFTSLDHSLDRVRRAEIHAEVMTNRLVGGFGKTRLAKTSFLRSMRIPRAKKRAAAESA